MKGEDLINIGIFSAIYFVIVFIISMPGRELMKKHFERRAQHG